MRLRLPDLLATRKGRLAAFFLLYVTEGLPLGFTAIALAAQMRRGGMGPAAIGVFVASLYLPWAFKWVAGPFVDVFSSDRWGRRRAWILATQLGMVATLVAAMPIDYVGRIGLFTAIVLLHNVLCAVQDVAIDALAVRVLPPAERGAANGFMYAGASVGQAIGGAGVLLLSAWMPFQATYLVVAGAILLITLFVVLPLKEPPLVPAEAAPAGLVSVRRRLGAFVGDAWRAFTGSRAAAVGVVVALLPAGAYALSLALQSNLAVELGFSNSELAHLTLASTVAFGLACVVGGWLSDRFGRRRMLALFIVLTVLPTLWLAWTLWRAGWVVPLDLHIANRPQPSGKLLLTFWTVTVVYNVFQGLYYGVRSALYMDITTPRVAATQFTAYMAMLNLVISYTAWWQGHAVVRWGYPVTLALDAAVGLLCLFLLPLMKPPAAAEPAVAAGRPSDATFAPETPMPHGDEPLAAPTGAAFAGAAPQTSGTLAPVDAPARIDQPDAETSHADAEAARAPESAGPAGAAAGDPAASPGRAGPVQPAAAEPSAPTVPAAGLSRPPPPTP
ncbi:MFS transporter [Piscinibacter koreensis]|uniref:MFS transporter n=1 Tax=Piscinibacter koreensis TaxID=2742824 RepID=A0A7Y6TV48_9BURK|nr:MFS transporter [Schlegelella koreensis]NUZ04566.1 MFS transporter [Schlegelella koreensis]